MRIGAGLPFVMPVRFLFSIVLATVSQLPATGQHKPARPNIVLILADDLGYGDLSCYGSEKINTPRIDKLAANGARFTNAYVGSSLCSPSRYSILTGRYSWRTRLKTGVLKPFSPPLIEAGRTTLPSMLKKAGYYTACVGKWHLGFDWALKQSAPADAEQSVFDSWGTEPQEHIDFSKPARNGPVERGFDYFFGIAGSNNMMPFVFIENDGIVDPPSVPNDFGPRTLKAKNWDARSLDNEFTSKAVELIDSHFQKRDNHPLFLYFSASAIHRPCLPALTKGESRAGLRGDMVLQFDRMAGEITKALQRNGALSNTLLIITSDNGPEPGDPYSLVERFRQKSIDDKFDYYQSYFGKFKPQYPGNSGQESGWLTYDHDPTAGLSGFKSDVWEGGLRVPFIVYWPEKIRAGAMISNIISTVDLLATLAEVTGQILNGQEGEDSYSFLPNLLDNQSTQARESLTMVAGRSGALVVRKEEWKYIEGADPGNWPASQAYPPPPNEYPHLASVLQPQLYDLKNDKFERRNLIDDLPEKAEELARVIAKVKAAFKTEGR